MSGGLWSADQLLRPQADPPADEQAGAIAPADTALADTAPAADRRLIPALSSWARAFPGVPRQVKVARQFVAALLDGSSRRDDAVIVISELFTNALQHTYSGRPGGLVVVQVSRWRLGVRIAVTDQGSAHRPVIRNLRANHDGATSVNANIPFGDSAVTSSAVTSSAFTDGVLPDDALTDDALTDDALTDDALTDGGLADGGLADRLLTDRLLAGGMFADDVLANGSDLIPADCGRGLYMVSCLAAHLDWHDDVRGRTVHAVLGRLPAAPPRLATPPGPVAAAGPAGSPRGVDQLEPAERTAAPRPPARLEGPDGVRAAHQVDVAYRSA
jgi:hypothetical protein